MWKRTTLLLGLILLLSACTTVTLKPANFAWPIENVLTTDEMGNVAVDRYSTEFNASDLFRAEFGDSTDVGNKQLRIIRDHLGYYVMTAPNFMNVYIFESEDGAFKLVNKVFITKDGLQSPALNQRSPNVELVDGNKKYVINSKGTVR